MGKTTQTSILFGSYFRNLLARNSCIRLVLNQPMYPGGTPFSRTTIFDRFYHLYVLASGESNCESLSCLARNGFHDGLSLGKHSNL